MGVLVGACNGAEPLSSTSDQAPRFELRTGEKFFRVNNQPIFVLGRNPVGMNPKEYADHFQHAAAAGERLVRIHFTFIPPGETPGEIDAGMLQTWNAILDAAERNGLAVLPVLGVWADWNDGSKKESWHTWDKNAFNSTRGGPAHQPRELFEDTPCRRLWLRRLERFVRLWSNRRAIVGWEIFSELDLVTGASEAPAVEFVERAAATIRSADPRKRPITASLSGVDEWPKLLSNPALDFIEIHPYADGSFGGRLDELILSTIHARLTRYGKPILIGESGLNSQAPIGTLDAAPRAEFGIRHAIWAALVSGAMNGRALWWEDGYDHFEKVDICRNYETVAVTAAEFVRDVDFTGFTPLVFEASRNLRGGVIGNDQMRIGWFRDGRCEPPEWPTEPVDNQSVRMEAPDGDWQVEFTDPVTGKAIGSTHLTVHDRSLLINLPTFRASVAFRMKRN